MTRRRPLYVPTQPRRCAGQVAGPAGHCLACGAPEGDLCQAPPSHRYRPTPTARSTAEQDAEANAFALELLMPADWLRRDAAGIDLLDARAVGRLAKKYRVEPQLMAVRLGQLMQ